MDVKLVVAKGKCHPRHLYLRGPSNVIGRQRGSTVRIPSPEVSRRHCELRVVDGYVTVDDLDSANGTFLNGERVLSAEVVRPGDHLQVGPLTFVVEYELSPAALDALIARSAPLAEDEALFEPDLPAEEPAMDEDPGLLPESEPAPTTAHVPIWKDNEDAPIPLLDLEDEESDREPAEASDRRETSLAGESWHLPEGQDLRNLLAKMDDPGRRADADE